MLSDERIRQIAEDIYCSEGTRAEIEHSIRAALAEAAQSPAVPVVERNQCDGCNRGLQVCDDGLHREPSGHPVMACTRNKYTHSIPATELERLRKDAFMWEARYKTLAVLFASVAPTVDEIDDSIDAAMQERQS